MYINIIVYCVDTIIYNANGSQACRYLIDSLLTIGQFRRRVEPICSMTLEFSDIKRSSYTIKQ